MTKDEIIKKRWKIVLDNKGLIADIIYKKFSWILEKSTILSFDDLLHVGCMGFYRAVQLYNPKLGFKISTYAYHWISQHIIREYYKNGFKFCRIPIHQHYAITKLMKEFEDLNLSKLYNEKKIDRKEYETLRVFNRENGIKSLDAYINDGEEFTLADLLEGVGHDELIKQLEKIDDKVLVEKACYGMKENMKKIIEARYGLNGCDEMSLRELSKIFKLSRERIRQIEVLGINRMIRYFKLNTIKFNDVYGRN